MAPNKKIEEEIESPLRMAFIDDRADQRTTMVRGLKHALPKNWECIDYGIFPNPQDYIQWIVNERISVLLVDQLLNEGPDELGDSADYKGHDVIAIVRNAFQEMPIFVVTAAPDDPDLEQRFGEADGIIGREDMLSNAKEHLKRILRQGSTFFEQHKAELNRFSHLSEAFATGSAKDEDLEELRALQVKLGMGTDAPVGQDILVGLLTDEVRKAKELADEIDQLVKKAEGEE